MPVDHACELLVELGDTLVEAFDLRRQVADAVGGRALGEATAEADLFEVAQRALGGDVVYGCFGFRSICVQIARSCWIASERR
jgi:hypothetical protein